MTKQEQLIIILLIIAALIGTGLLYHRKFYKTQVTPEVVKAKEVTVSKGAVQDSNPVREGSSNEASGEKININIAGVEDLETLPQIGPKIAGYILAYRNNHGPFMKISEIKNVDKVGEATFKKIEDLITVE